MKLRTKIILAVVGITSTIYFYKCYRDYYAEYDIVKRELNKIEDITIKSIDGNPDLTLEVYSATIELKNGNILSFSCDAWGRGFKDLGGVNILRINNWEFHETGCSHSSSWGASSLVIGQNSKYPELNELNVKNIKDVIQHFDEIKTFLDKISTYPDFDTINRQSDTLLFQKFDTRKITDTRVLKWVECK